jgi:hypothetical protein
MVYSSRFFDLDHLHIKKIVLMHTHKFEDENQAMYCPLDMEGLMHTMVYHFSCPGALFMHNSFL